MQRPRGFVILQEVRDMATTSVQGFEGQGKFKPYAPFYRKQIELFEEHLKTVDNHTG